MPQGFAVATARMTGGLRPSGVFPTIAILVASSKQLFGEKKKPLSWLSGPPALLHTCAIKLGTL